MSRTFLTDAFENVKDQVGACGIWCGSCVIGNGTLRELTRRYRQTISDYGLEKWGPKEFDWEEFSKGLASLERLPVCPGCLRGGGRENCEIRACASQRHLDHCAACSIPASCPHAVLLGHMRSGAVAAALFVLPEGAQPAALVKEWTAALKARWPCSVLFSQEMTDR